MSSRFRVPLSQGDHTPLVFPRRCVACGVPATAESTLVVAKLVEAKQGRGRSQVAITRKFPVPHCDACARSTKAVFLAALIPFGLGFLVAGAIAFAFVTAGAWRLGIDEIGKPHNNNSLLLGAAAGLAAGIAGAFLFESIARLLLLPFFGTALLRAPMLTRQMFTDDDYVAGLAGRPNADATMLTLTFSNDQIAQEFAMLNRTATPIP